MNEAEALKVVNKIISEGMLCDDAVMDYSFWYRVKDALARAELYKRHDLRKNPEDLPKADGQVLIEFTWRGSSRVYQAVANFTYGYFHSPTDAKIIAWRYIEPVEEEAK